MTTTTATVDAPTRPAAGAARLWEVDVARTVAILMMATYHVGWDIGELAPSVPIDPFSGGWRALQIATGSSFLALVGVSLAISDGRSRARGRSFAPRTPATRVARPRSWPRASSSRS